MHKGEKQFCAHSLTTASAIALANNIILVRTTIKHISKNILYPLCAQLHSHIHIIIAIRIIFALGIYTVDICESHEILATCHAEYNRKYYYIKTYQSPKK